MKTPNRFENTNYQDFSQKHDPCWNIYHICCEFQTLDSWTNQSIRVSAWWFQKCLVQPASRLGPTVAEGTCARVGVLDVELQLCFWAAERVWVSRLEGLVSKGNSQYLYEMSWMFHAFLYTNAKNLLILGGSCHYEFGSRSEIFTRCAYTRCQQHPLG